MLLLFFLSQIIYILIKMSKTHLSLNQPARTKFVCSINAQKCCHSFGEENKATARLSGQPLSEGSVACASRIALVIHLKPSRDDAH